MVVRILTEFDELQRLVDLFDDVWAGAGSPPVSTEHLRALSHSGNYISAAYDGDLMLGGSVAFFGPPAARTRHSDVVGLVAVARDRHLGFTLKLHQRAWALAHQVETLTWTFDPLMSRNAYLNLTKLRARGVSYHINFYGQMTDAINRGQGSDRLLLAWPLSAPDVVSACDGSRPPGRLTSATGGDIPVLLDDAAGLPVELSVDAGASQLRVAVPADIDEVRRSAPDLGRRWREAVRRTLGAELASGARITGFDRGAGYLVDRTAADADLRG